VGKKRDGKAKPKEKPWTRRGRTPLSNFTNRKSAKTGVFLNPKLEMRGHSSIQDKKTNSRGAEFQLQIYP